MPSALLTDRRLHFRLANCTVYVFVSALYVLLCVCILRSFYIHADYRNNRSLYHYLMHHLAACGMQD